MTSPGPGWWQASDGNWYPQQWEYSWLTTSLCITHKDAVESIAKHAAAYGAQGWEMVNYTVEHEADSRWWIASAIVKRPVVPR